MKVGDTVKIVHKQRYSGLSWPDEMDDTLGETGKITEISRGRGQKHYRVRFDSRKAWWYIKNSLKPIIHNNSEEDYDQ